MVPIRHPARHRGERAHLARDAVPFSEHHPRLKNPESTLAFLVHLSAIMLFTALGTAVTPHTWMGAIHRQIGPGGTAA